MHCPLCGISNEIILTDRLRHGEKQNVFYCPSCDLGYLEHMKNNAELKHYYQNVYRKDYKPNLLQDTNAEDLFRSTVGFQQERVRRIEPFLNKNKALLDVGCSAGQFLFHVKDKVNKAVGIEINEESAQFASKICGCPVYTDYLAETPLKRKSFDIICSFQVMEHVDDPLEYLLQFKEYLKDDGLIYIEVPNLNDILLSTYSLPNYKKFYFRSAHLFYFSVRSLEVLLDKAGLDGEVFFSQDYHFINHMNWLINDGPQANAEDGMANLKFPMNLGVSGEIQTKLNGFLTRVNKEYTELLIELGLTSKMGFIARKKKN
ncbi:class I SAM-dependent methyltransferase [Paenibacillus sp. sptzw28]|uniref:class I SAM-dependent methyltransferase n=1 Tax=Paenibacillus sp. sptzw28 TaxID=715179 RepID=UPI001C6DE8E0|nr:class I SAM-dependent methyltransferase [Paenibacillus sp. sptzw28]QYR19840.1 class I SAM-dependent methyltransferase [Paenibacillus sp. sptzw28]